MGASYRPPSMADMVQMITSLGELQESKKRREQSDTQFKQQQEMLAQRLGFEKQSEGFQEAQALLRNLADAPPDARPDIYKLSLLMGMPSDKAGQISQVVAGLMKTVPQSAASFQNTQTQQGFNSLPPEVQQALRQQAASTTMTGMNTGQVAQAGVQGQVMGSAANTLAGNPDMLRQLGVGAVTGQYQPVQGAIAQRQMADPNAIANLARLAGGGMSEAQAASARTEAQSVAQTGAYQQTEAALRTAALSNKVPLSAAEAVKAFPDLNALLQLTQNPKISDAARRQARLQYNTFKRLMQASGVDLSSLPDLNPNQP